MTKKLILVSILISGLFFSSCLRDEEVYIDGPEDTSVSMTIEKSFGENAAQMIKVVFKNNIGEITELEDGIVKFNDIIIDWNKSAGAYYTDLSYILPENHLNVFEITFPNGYVSTNEILTSTFFENVNIPTEININENSEITWEGGNPDDEVILIVWSRPLEMESWEVLFQETTSDDGSFILISSIFEEYMGNWQVAIEIARGIQGEPDPLLMDDSELYSIFIFGNYGGELVDY